MHMRKLYLLLRGGAFFTVQVLAQRTVTRKVTDVRGSPFPNALIPVKGTNTGRIPLYFIFCHPAKINIFLIR